MSSRLARRAQPAVLELRPRLPLRERLLFDLLCAAGEQGYRLPDNINLRSVTGVRDPRRRLLPLLRRLRRQGGQGNWTDARDGLARRLAEEFKRRGDGELQALRTLLAYSGGGLAPDCLPPSDPLLALALGTVIRTFRRLYGSGIHPLGTLPFIGPGDLAKLLAETHSSARGRHATGRKPGPLGCELAVDPRLMSKVGRALKKPMSPGYEARYLFYSKPGDYFWPHPDDPVYGANVLLCLERRLPDDGGRPSCFFAFRPDGGVRRIDLEPGEALVAEARGVIHGREPLRQGEKLTLLSIEIAEGAAKA